MSDQARFDELLLPHLDAGYNLARWLARDAHDAEDVLQEACMRALRYLPGVRAGGARAWFLTVVRHAFYDWCQRNRPEQLLHAGDDMIAEIADADDLDPEQMAVRNANAKRLAAAVAQLPVAFREVLVLREFEDLSYKDIARITGVPTGTVMSRLARARDLLQRSPLLQALCD